MSSYPTPSVSTLFEKTEHWFDRAQAGLLGNLPCRQGCSHCCVGIFPVTILDQEEIQRGLHLLPSDQRHAIEQRAAHQVSRISSSMPQLAQSPFIDPLSDQEIDQLVEQHSTLPCPALGDDGSCGLYAFRPLACRSMGIPSDVDGVVQGACAVQTSVPLTRLSPALRREENLLASAEAEQISHLHQKQAGAGEELFLPYAFLPKAFERPASQAT